MSANKPLTKSQLAEAMVNRAQELTDDDKAAPFNKKSAVMALDILAELACSETKKCQSFSLPGIGKLVLINRSAREGRNPSTGEKIQIPAKKAVKFRISKSCKDSIVPA